MVRLAAAATARRGLARPLRRASPSPGGSELGRRYASDAAEHRQAGGNDAVTARPRRMLGGRKLRGPDAAAAAEP